MNDKYPFWIQNIFIEKNLHVKKINILDLQWYQILLSMRMYISTKKMTYKITYNRYFLYFLYCFSEKIPAHNELVEHRAPYPVVGILMNL